MFGIATQNAFYNFQESKIYFTKNNLFINIFRFHEMPYYFISNFAFSFSFFLLKLIEPHMHSNSVQERERINGDKRNKTPYSRFFYSNLI